MIAYFKNINIIRKIFLIISLYFSGVTFLILILSAELLPSAASRELFWISSSAEIRALLAFLSLIYFLLIIYFKEKLDNYDLILTFVYYIAGLTAIASQNLIVILLALEILSLSATFLIAKSGRLGPALTYGILSFLSGAMFMAAISTVSINSMTISSIAHMEYFNKMLLFLSIIMHCGLWPISIAVVNGYSAASPPHAAFLQLFSTKACLIVLYKLFLSQGLLLYFSAVTIIYSLFYSFRENNLRRLITYNTIGQVGLISLAIFLKGNIIPHVIVSALYQTLLFIIISQICSSIEQPAQPLFTHLKCSIMRPSLALLALIVITASMMALPLTASFITKAIMLENAHVNYKSYYYFFIIGNFLLVLAVPLRILYSLFLQNSPAFEKFQLKMKIFKGILVPSKLADTYISEITIEDLITANKGLEEPKQKTEHNTPQVLTSVTPLASTSSLVLLPSGVQEIQFSQTRRQKLIIILFSIILVLPPFYLQEFPLFYTFPSIIWGVKYFLIYLLIVVACAFTTSKKFLLALLTIILALLALLYCYSYFPNPYVTYSFSHIIEPLIYGLITIGLAFYFRKKLYNGSFASAAKYNYSYYSQDVLFFCVNFLPYLFSLFQKLLAYSHFLCQTYIKALISYYGKASTAISATSETQGKTQANIVELTGLLALSLLGIFLLLRLIF